MVTIVLMLLLMALLLPALRHVRQATQSATCQSHLREMGMATWLYGRQHYGAFPPLAFEVRSLPRLPDQAVARAFEVRLTPRTLPASGLSFFEPPHLQCPSDDEPGAIPVRANGQRQWDVSYGYNAVLLRDRLTQEQVNDDRAIFYDGTMGRTPARPRGAPGRHADGHVFAQRTLLPRHADRFNVLFADQSVGARQQPATPMFDPPPGQR